MCPAAASSRWCPTPEQLMILEEMYIGGIRTPNASQIQQITAHLSFYGKIEGKNVFYWFQNHKARDRQKLRRKLSKQLYQQQQHHHQHQGRNQDFCERGAKGGVVDASTQMMSCTLNTDHLPDSCEIDKAMIMRTYGRDWMMMMLDVGPTPTSPCYNKVKPPKTLELFPITATGHKDKHCATSKHIPSSTTSTN